jgi:hypothetical protein
VTTTPSLLHQLIATYLSGELALPEFWKQFTFTWADADAADFSASDEVFFSKVADRLHYVDFSSPAEPFLGEPHDFREWLASAVSGLVGT